MPDLSPWQFIDGILLVAEDPAYLCFCFHYLTFLLTQAGFLISPKSSSAPTSDITWLGKRLSSPPLQLRNSPASVARAVLFVSYLYL